MSGSGVRSGSIAQGGILRCASAGGRSPSATNVRPDSVNPSWMCCVVRCACSRPLFPFFKKSTAFVARPMPKRTAAEASSFAAPSKRSRRALPQPRLDAIRAANPDLEDEQGARAHLLPLQEIDLLLQPGCWRPDASALQQLDLAVDLMCGKELTIADRRLWERTSRLPADPRDLQLFTLDSSPEMLAAALWSGFFPFASEYAFAGRALASRGLLNLELGGPEVDRQEGDPGGRLVLDLSQGSPDRLTLGKRSIKKVRSAHASCEGDHQVSGTPYRLTVCADFERSWEQIVAKHGVDWCGFDSVRAAYSALHRLGRTTQQHQRAGKEMASRGSSAVGDVGDGDSGTLAFPPRIISLELWDTSRPDELVSAEVGALVGRCYVCLSLFARVEEYPKCDWVRAQAAILWLRRHGVELFDAGTTAEYYATNFGFRRCASREAFVELWRNRRSRPLATPFDVVCASACDDVRGLLEAYLFEVSPSERISALTSSQAQPAAKATTRALKPTVRITGFPTTTGAIDETQVIAALTTALPSISAADIARVAIVDSLGAVFVTFAEEWAAAAALTLDGCPLALASPPTAHGTVDDDESAAPIVSVIAHGRKVKGQRPGRSTQPSSRFTSAEHAMPPATVDTVLPSSGRASGLPPRDDGDEAHGPNGAVAPPPSATADVRMAPCSGGEGVALTIHFAASDAQTKRRIEAPN